MLGLATSTLLASSPGVYDVERDLTLGCLSWESACVGGRERCVDDVLFVDVLMCF